MIKFYILLLPLLYISCKTKEEKTADEFYNNFKQEISSDSLSVLAKMDAEYVANFHYDNEKKKEAQGWLNKYEIYSRESDQEREREKQNNN